MITLPVFLSAREQIALRDLNGALWTLTKALQESPNDLAAEILKADVFIQLKDLTNADEPLNTLTETYGAIPPSLIKRGD